METTTNPTTTARTIAAEARAVLEGHHARYDFDRHAFLVRSDSKPVDYEVRIASQGAELRASCTCPAGRHAPHGVKPLPCKHSLVVTRNLERRGLATWTGQRWVVAGDLAQAVAA